MTLSVRHLGTRFGEGKMALETTRLPTGFSDAQNTASNRLWPRTSVSIGCEIGLASLVVAAVYKTRRVAHAVRGIQARSDGQRCRRVRAPSKRQQRNTSHGAREQAQLI